MTYDVEYVRAWAAITFVPVEDLEATACLVIARDRANFPRMPMRLRHERPGGIWDHWVAEFRLPGTDRVWQMTFPGCEVEIAMKGRPHLDILRCRFMTYRSAVVDALASMTLTQFSCPSLIEAR